MSVLLVPLSIRKYLGKRRLKEDLSRGPTQFGFGASELRNAGYPKSTNEFSRAGEEYYVTVEKRPFHYTLTRYLAAN
jgi:hypothetical protein